ncbi:MAG TPA: outer membrane lipoprotein carrier protein LolA [Polyangia bacterium]|nr:outer membrane lipoprotein carrier protein LolA [Polyangia bacterium]
MIASVLTTIVAAAVATSPAPGARLSTNEVVARIQRRYDGAKDFRAHFTQTLTNAAFGRKSSSAGEVLLKKPGRMRWNYTQPEPKMYLADGNVLWLYEPEDKQAFKQDLKSSQLPAALAFLTGQGKLAAEFDITTPNMKTSPPGYGTSTDYVLSLSPKAPQAQVKAILFVVDPTTFDVRETVIFDQQGNVNDLTFSDLRFNTAIPDPTFRWAPPAGVRLIDTAKLGK